MLKNRPTLGRLLALMVLSGGLVQCGKKTKSELVEFAITPQEPIVINASPTIDGVQIKGPYYRFTLHVTNGTPEPVTLAAFIIKTMVQNQGLPVEKEVTADAAEFNRTVTIGEASCLYEFTGFDTIPAGESSELTVTDLAPEGSVPGTEEKAPIICPPMVKVPVQFYIGDNPDVGDFRYRVRVTPIGWFGTATDQYDRLETHFEFRTR